MGRVRLRYRKLTSFVKKVFIRRQRERNGLAKKEEKNPKKHVNLERLSKSETLEKRERKKATIPHCRKHDY